MRIRTCIILMLATVAPGAVFPQSPLVSKWEKVGPVNFTALTHQSPTRIVATTSHGYLYITDDDGTTWQRREVGDSLDLTAISFGDSLHGMILQNGTNAWFTGSNAVVTTDGGHEWQPKEFPIIDPFYVSCIGADTAFIVNWIGNVYRSTDGGVNWVEQYKVPGSDTATMTGCMPTKITFLDSKRGYVLGNCGMFVQTSDGGEHWSANDITKDGTTLTDLNFYDRNAGVVVGWGAYYVTTDGGVNWSIHKMPHDETYNDFSAVSFFNATSFFAFGQSNGLLSVSNDLGATIRPTSFPQSNAITSVVKTATGGWLAVGGGWGMFQNGGSGTIVRGTLPPENATAPLWDVLAECPVGGNAQIHATNGGMLQCISDDVTSDWLTYPLVSTDSGIFWHVADQRYQGYAGFHFPSPDTGYLYNNSNLTAGMRTLDSGQSWKPVVMQSPLTSGGIGYPSFGSRDAGYALANGYVLTTTDCGMHWKTDTIPQPTVSPYPDCKVYDAGPQHVYAVDSLHAFVMLRVRDSLIVQKGKNFYYGMKIHNAFYQTTDGGVTWSNLDNFPVIHALGTIYFRTASVGFLTCDSGRIYRTSDGGKNWTLEQLESINHGFGDIKFLNDRVGFLTVDSAAVLETTDEGLTWTRIPIPTNREEVSMATASICFPDPTTILISEVRTMFLLPDPMTPAVYEFGFYRAKIPASAASVAEHKPAADPNALSISTYPNPARDAIHVQVAMRAPAPMRVDLLDILGRTLYSCAETNADFTLNVASLPDGVYTLRCAAGGESATAPFTLAR